jgi:hypothetical protein
VRRVRAAATLRDCVAARNASERRWLTDPRASVVVLAVVLVAAVALDHAIVVGLAMGGLAGFSLSGSP